MLKVNEIFHSIQGESTHAGRPCVLVRLTGCNLRCAWCDTAYAFYEGEDLTISQVIERVAAYDCGLVELTGGEPLLQGDSITLMEWLLEDGYEVLLETGGSLSVQQVPSKVVKIVDFKAPSSGMVRHNLWSILDELAPHDELKFVIGDRNDYDWACARIAEYDLARQHTVLISPVSSMLEPGILAGWFLADPPAGDRTRLQLQLHKAIWGSDRRGV